MATTQGWYTYIYYGTSESGIWLDIVQVWQMYLYELKVSEMLPISAVSAKFHSHKCTNVLITQFQICIMPLSKYSA